MKLKDVTIKNTLTHKNSIVAILHFDNNSKNHFLSLSDDGELKEWIIEATGEFIDIGPCKLIRPSDDILIQNKHKIQTISQNEYISISKVIQFKNFIVLGYDDGLILVYQQDIENWEQKEAREKEMEEKKEMEKKKENKEKEGNEEKEDNGENKENEDVEEKEEEKEKEEVKEDNEEKEIKEEKEVKDNREQTIKSYSNYFTLYYILLGHFQKITALHYIEQTNMLVTASSQCIVKMYDMETGHSLYHFNLDCIVHHILHYEKKKNKFICFICKEPFKIEINTSKEPYSFNHYTLEDESIVQTIQKKDGIYLLISNGTISYYDNSFEKKKTYGNKGIDEYQYFFESPKGFYIFDGNGDILFTTLDIKNDTFNIDYKVKAGDSVVSAGIQYDNFIILGCHDGNIYEINCAHAEESFQMVRMKDQNELSDSMNKEIDNKKGKTTKGKEKGKEDKKAKGKKK